MAQGIRQRFRSLGLFGLTVLLVSTSTVFEISDASSEMGILLWEQLAHVKIMTTAEPLVMFPPQKNTLIRVNPKLLPNVQAGYRDGDDVLFAESALIEHKPDPLKKPDEAEQTVYPPSYTVLHELLHGMVPGSREFHQMKVGGLNDFFRDNRGHYTAELIAGAAQAADVSLRLPFFTDLDRKAFDVVIHERGSFQARCWIAMAIWYDQTSRSWEPLLVALSASSQTLERLGYASCYKKFNTSRLSHDTEAQKYFLQLHPKLAQLKQAEKEHDVSIPFPFGIASFVGGAVQRPLRELYMDYCRKNSDALKEQLAQALSVSKDSLAEIRDIERTEPADPAEAVFQKIVLMHTGLNVSVSDYESRANNAQKNVETWEADRAACKKAFPELYSSDKSGASTKKETRVNHSDFGGKQGHR